MSMREDTRTIIKPIPEAIEAMLNQILGRSKIEPRID